MLPRIADTPPRRRVHGGADEATAAALAAQEEPLVDDEPAAVAHLVAGAAPAPDWSRRLLDAHEEGWAAVGPGARAREAAAPRDPARRGGWARRAQSPLRAATPAAVAARRPRAG